MSNRILLVEDEENIRKFTKINLEREGYEVLEAGSGEEGIVIAEEKKPEIAILDVMLPGINGYEVCNYLRENMDNIGIIMLTAKTQDDDKITGFEHGADDYLSKPFNPKELILRIKSLARRIKPEENVQENLIVLKPFSLDLYSKIFKKNDKEIVLTPNELHIATLFLKNREKLSQEASFWI